MTLFFFFPCAFPVCCSFIIVIMLSLVTGLFFLVLLLLNQWRSPPLRFQASDFSTFCIVCDVPGICVFCSASIKSFAGMASKFFHKPFVTILVAAVIAGIIIHLKFYIHCISIHKLLYFSFFSPSFCSTFLSTVIATSVIMHVFSFLFLIIIYVLFSVTSLCVCTARFHNSVTPSCSYTDMGARVSTVCLSFQCLGLCILSNANVHKLYRVSLSTLLRQNGPS